MPISLSPPQARSRRRTSAFAVSEALFFAFSEHNSHSAACQLDKIKPLEPNGEIPRSCPERILMRILAWHETRNTIRQPWIEAPTEEKSRSPGPALVNVDFLIGTARRSNSRSQNHRRPRRRNPQQKQS